MKCKKEGLKDLLRSMSCKLIKYDGSSGNMFYVDDVHIIMLESVREMLRRKYSLHKYFRKGNYVIKRKGGRKRR